MAECSMYKKNLDRCNCSYDGCPRKGHCCECLHYHLASGGLPACAFTDEQEKTYNRSVSYFVKTHQ